MSESRALRWFILLLVLAIVALALHGSLQSSGSGREGMQPPPARDSRATPAAGVHGAGGATHGDDAALREAASTLREYLSILPTGDFAKADAHWMQARTSGDEADLRALPGLPASIRVQTRSPQAQPSNPAPGTVEIPFELRLDMPGEGFRHYRGRYRLARGDDGTWKITSASVDAPPPPG